MRAHPLNPMTDSDLRRCLRAQTRYPVGAVTWETVHGGSGRIRPALAAATARGERLVVVDAITDEDLVAIGEACAGDCREIGGRNIVRCRAA